MILNLTESQIADILIAMHGEQVSAQQNGIDGRVKHLNPIIAEIRKQFEEQLAE